MIMKIQYICILDLQLSVITILGHVHDNHGTSIVLLTGEGPLTGLPFVLSHLVAYIQQYHDLYLPSLKR